MIKKSGKIICAPTTKRSQDAAEGTGRLRPETHSAFPSIAIVTVGNGRSEKDSKKSRAKGQSRGCLTFMGYGGQRRRLTNGGKEEKATISGGEGGLLEKMKRGLE